MKSGSSHPSSDGFSNGSSNFSSQGSGPGRPSISHQEASHSAGPAAPDFGGHGPSGAPQGTFGPGGNYYLIEIKIAGMLEICL